MAVYKSVKVDGGCGHQPVYKVDEGEFVSILSPVPSQKLCNHSPDGFNWGYGGSGPAQLALALLYDVTGDREKSLGHYQDFKWQFVAEWGDRWEITTEQILAWLEKEVKECS